MYPHCKFVSIVSVAMFWIFSGGSIAFGFGNDTPVTVETTGTATLKTSPDRLRLNVAIMAKGETIDEAIANLAKRRSEITGALAGTGAEPKSIRFEAPRENELFQRGLRVLKSIRSITEAEQKQLKEEVENVEKNGDTSHVPTPSDLLIELEQIFTGEGIDYDTMNAEDAAKPVRDSARERSSPLQNDRIKDNHLPRIPESTPPGAGLIDAPSIDLKTTPNSGNFDPNTRPSAPNTAPRSHLQPILAPGLNEEYSLPALPPGLNQENSLPPLPPGLNQENSLPPLPPPGLNQEVSLRALAPKALPPAGLYQEDSLRGCAESGIKSRKTFTD